MLHFGLETAIACGADLASDLADLKALIHMSSSEYCERTVDVILSEGHYQRHLNRLRDRLGQEALLPQKIVMAPGRIFSVDSSQASPWSRFNVGAVADPRFAKALRATLKRWAA